LKKVAYFSAAKSDRKLTSFTTHSTTNSPQKHHAEHHVFSKTPAKTPVRHARKKYCKIIPVVRGLPGQQSALIAVD
jgi:hypothetical protein